MRGDGPDHDEIDVVIGDEIHNGDVAATAAIVHDLRSAYLTDEPLVRSTALMAAMDSPRATTGAGMESTGRNRKVFTKISALAAGVTGKIVLGAAVAAAAAGGLSAADVIEVPNLGDAAENDPPGLAVAADRAPDAADEPSDETTSSTTTSEAEAEAESLANEDGQATAEAAHAKADAAAAFSAAIDDWVGCVSEEAAAHPEGEGRFDPTEACGERPHPSDFGLTTPPSQNHDANPSEANRSENNRSESNPSETNRSENARNESDNHGNPDRPEPAGGSSPQSNPATADDTTPAAGRPGKGPADNNEN